MKVLISGASGLIGSATSRALSAAGYDVFKLARAPNTAHENTIFWDPYAGTVSRSVVENADILIHLSGVNIASGRWTDKRKQEILESRTKTTQFLANVLTELKNPPRVWLCASAVGYYGDRGAETLTEDSPPGEGFLCEVCSAWEKATALPEGHGTRVVNLRFGAVLDSRGGMLARLLPLFRWGLGGVLGSGTQYMSWVTLQDVVRVIETVINGDRLSGPVNVVAPEPVTNREFTKSLGKALRRPTVCHAPAPLLRLVLGELADALLLASTRAVPKKLESVGFEFRHKTLSDAWSALL